MKLSFGSKYFIAFVLGLIVVFVIDPLDRSTLSTPLCLGIILMGISLRQGPTLVATIAMTYIIFTVYALIQFHRYFIAHGNVTPHPYFWLFQRSALFVVMCGMAVYLAYYRTDTERILSRFRTVLVKLPVPVVVSDAAGNITYANDALTPILHQTTSELIGKSYFNFFKTRKSKGEFIRFYFELFEAETNGPYELEVHPFGENHRINVQISVLGSGLNRILITVLENSERTTPQPSLT